MPSWSKNHRNNPFHTIFWYDFFFSLAGNRNLKADNKKNLVLSVCNIRCVCMYDSGYFLCFWTCLNLYITVLTSNEQKILFQFFFAHLQGWTFLSGVYLSLKAMVAQLYVQLHILPMHKEPRAIGTHKRSALKPHIALKEKDGQMPRSVWMTPPRPSVPWFAASILGRQSSSFHSLTQQAAYYFQK